ncbi:hypothetical protein SCARR_00602 [Pontiella sulfatireligans]|uniref:Sulfatase N-terminal domain-containing protein n=2 Tax=Pontiella sulfatireligans TaxID=2750658 RepID=A0A6C2UF52_9BACT|nr:hypothetical protein SCARR_00602 [Pontiella sulfatireligans]
MKLFITAILATGLIGSALAADRPNIVFLMTGDQSIHSMGCYGNGDVQAPNLNRRASVARNSSRKKGGFGKKSSKKKKQ